MIIIERLSRSASRGLRGGGVLAAALCCLVARAEDVPVAVAANFRVTLEALAPGFEKSTGHHLVPSYGSTGRFYAQIRAGAPFHVLLAADAQTPARLEQEGLGVPGTRFTYATGRLVLWSPVAGVVDDQGAVLRSGHFEHLALANPRVAPYGAAAQSALQSLGLLPALQQRLVQGEDITQAFEFVATGNASLGFVALSQVMREGRVVQGSAWIVPAQLYAPLRQDAVVLAAGRDHPGAAALLRYLQGDAARALLRAFGYEA